MNNDLISREYLKEYGTVIGMVNGQKMKVVPLSVIDNAPTVEAYPFEQVQELVKLNQQFAQEIENFKRPQGENKQLNWLDRCDDDHLSDN